MSIINIAMFTFVSIFVLLLFFTAFSKRKPKNIVTSLLQTNSFFTADIDENDKVLDDAEKKFNKEYEDKNKEISNLQKTLDLCNNSRVNINNAIQKFRDDLINTVNDTSAIKQKEVDNCDIIRDSRIQKYINAYNKRFNSNINRQQVINKIANNSLNSK